MTFREWLCLPKIDACKPALAWLGDRDAKTAWAECPDARWMLWLFRNATIDRRLLVMAAVDCARTALRFVPDDCPEPEVCLDIAELWTLGEATIGNVREARDWVYSSADFADFADFAAAAAAAAAADADDDLDAADFAADAADAALRDMADLVRARIPWAVVEAALARVMP
jgi:hypothetical protein